MLAALTDSFRSDTPGLRGRVSRTSAVHRAGHRRRASRLAGVSLSIGIVGLPNVGKSTLFNALTRASALASNYPFATIEPNVGVVGIPDPRLPALGGLYDSAKIVPATVRFVDIAAWSAAPHRARAWVISSSPTSGKPTRSARSYGSSPIRT